jgi:branched-chain amino acid transport system permease protein
MGGKFDLEEFVGDSPRTGEQATIRSVLDPRSLPLRHKVGLVGVVVLFLLPLLLTPLQIRPLIQVLFLMMFVMSWDAISGYTGQMSFGHAFFFGLGGYTTAVLNIQHSVHPLLSIPVGVLVAMFGGVLIGVPALRLRGPYLSLVTLITPMILLQLFRIWSQWLVVDIGPVTLPIAPEGFGGTIGIPGSPQDIVSTRVDAVITVSSFQEHMLVTYYLSAVLLVVILAVLLAFTRSNTGDVLTAIREDEEAVAASGLNPAKFKVFAFVLSAAVGGFASAVYVHTTVGFAQPGNILSFELSIQVMILSIIGGMGTIVGAIVGTLFFFIFEGIMSGIDLTIPLLGEDLETMSQVLLYTIAIGIVLYQPRGLAPILVRTGGWIVHRSGGRDEADDHKEPPIMRVIESYRDDLMEMIGKK